LICGKPLNAKKRLPCLFAPDALDAAAGEPKAAVLAFAEFQIKQCADGSYWELGHCATDVTYIAVDKVLRQRVVFKVIKVPLAARLPTCPGPFFA